MVVCLVLMLVVLVAVASRQEVAYDTYADHGMFNASVVELPEELISPDHRSLSDPVAALKERLDKYERIIETVVAQEKNVQLVVFPQHGIQGVHTTPETLPNFLYTISTQPQVRRWRPCESEDEANSQNSDAVYRLSCMAKKKKVPTATLR